MLESLEKLRKYVAANTDKSYVLTSYPPQYRVVCSTTINDLIDAVEREVEEQIEERYIELPKDKDGERIHIGDMLQGELVCGGWCEPFEVETIAFYGDETFITDTAGLMHKCAETRHKPPTVEDVLEEFASERIGLFFRMPMGLSDEEIREYQEENREACEKLIAEYAAKLQLREAE